MAPATPAMLTRRRAPSVPGRRASTASSPVPRTAIPARLRSNSINARSVAASNVQIRIMKAWGSHHSSKRRRLHLKSFATGGANQLPADRPLIMPQIQCEARALGEGECGDGEVHAQKLTRQQADERAGQG